MKAVILAGGLGTRLSEETDLKPKPMIEIGGRPILWHIMKIYAAHGITNFIICCGYKGYLMPFFSASSAVLFVGSIPRQGIFFFKKFFSKYPSFEATSKTNELFVSFSSFSISSQKVSTCFNQLLDVLEKYAYLLSNSSSALAKSSV